MLFMFFFNAKESPAIFYALSGLTQFFFSGFNTAIYAIFQTAWNMGNGKPDLEMTVFSMHLFRLEIKSEWQLEHHF